MDNFGDILGLASPLTAGSANKSTNSGNQSSSKSSGNIWNFLEGLNKPMENVFNGIGSGIDMLGDLTIGNLIGLADEEAGNRFKESTNGETYAWIPSSAVDLLTWTLPGSAQLKLGLLGAKALAESSGNLKEAFTGKDSETGKQLDAGERIGSGLMGALNSALTVLPGAPLAKSLEKEAALSLAKQGEKNLVGSEVKNLNQARKALDNIETADLPEGTKKIIGDIPDKGKVPEYVAAPGTSQKAVDEILEKNVAKRTQLEEAISNTEDLIKRQLEGKLAGQEAAPKFAGQEWTLATGEDGISRVVPVQGTASKKNMDLADIIDNKGFFPVSSAATLRKMANQKEGQKGIRTALRNMLKSPETNVEIPQTLVPSRYNLSVEDMLPEGKTLSDLGLKENAKLEDVLEAIANPLKIKYR